MIRDAILYIDLDGLRVPGMDAIAGGDIGLCVEFEFEPAEQDVIWGTAPGEASPGCPEYSEVIRVTAHGPIKCMDEEYNVVLIIQDKADVTKWLAPEQMRAIEDQIFMNREMFAC